jgi:NTP pyrophosphatase (non-canonical NTP hydrolase)
MRETQDTVAKWAVSVFGPAGSNARCAARANEEMAELLRALTADDNHPKAVEEVADVVIVLYRLADRMGFDLHAEIDRKMLTNRERAWERDGDCGYHIRLKR